MQSILNLGADVDSRSIVIACSARSFATLRIANERKSISAWLRSVPRGSRLGMESTGTYHELLAELAAKAGLQVFVINARALRRYAQSLGRRGKTDRLDGEVIARYVAREHDDLHAYTAPTKEQRTLACLMKRRAKLVELKAALTQSPAWSDQHAWRPESRYECAGRTYRAPRATHRTDAATDTSGTANR